MSKVATALLSFSFGVLTTFVSLSGSHTSTLAQTPAPQPPPAPQTARRLGPLIAGGAGIPVVPPITQHFQRFGLSATLPFGVDGSECDECVFSGIALRYGGGNFQFTNFKFSGPLRIEFVGAAFNTLKFIDFINRLAAGQQPKPNPNVRIVRTEMIKTEITGTFGISE